MLKGKAPWAAYDEDRAWLEIDDTRATDWLQHNGIFIARTVVGEAIELAAKDNSYHPILEYLKRCQWDGEYRLDEWPALFLGAIDTPLARAMASRWMISAVARVMQPGCKADCALILEGRQGLLKSTALKTLFSPWFTDEIADLGSKDSAMQLPGAWCIEIAELDAIGRSEVSKIKAFMSRDTDRFRPAYGHRVIEQPRQSVFCGTVNHNEYLRDETGGRRFWPITCSIVDIDGLSYARDQLWGEARDRYLAGEIWWLDTAELNIAAAVEQDGRRIIDPWQREVQRIVLTQNSTTASEVLIDLGIPIKDQQQLHWNRAAACLKAIGWRAKSMRYAGKPVYRYVPPDADP